MSCAAATRIGTVSLSCYLPLPVSAATRRGAGSLSCYIPLPVTTSTRTLCRLPPLLPPPPCSGSYQDGVRGFFLRQVEASRRRHDGHSGQLLERLQAASLVDARAAHLENLVGRLLDSDRPGTSLHYYKYVWVAGLSP